jgi:tetratricopeptide (TPR) repeat protein
MLRSAVAMDRRHVRADDQRLGSVLCSLAFVLMHRGAYEEAIQALNEAIRIQSLPGADLADLAESLTSLSTTYHLQGRDQEAQPLAERVLAIHRGTYGESHPGVAEDLTNLAQIREQLGFYAEA